MNIYLYRDGIQLAEVFNLQHLGRDEYSFECVPPLLDTDPPYQIMPNSGRPMHILISEATIINGRSFIKAVETKY